MDIEQTAQMAQWIHQRRDLMAEILRLTLRQETAIQSGLVETLVEVLREKELRIDELRDLQDRLAPMAGVASTDRQWPDPRSREGCRREIEETEKLRTAVLEIDARCEQAMLHRREELFDSLRHTTGAAGASRAYASANRTSGSTPRGGSFDLTSG